MLALFFVSGSLGLIYEVVWLRMLILIFGSTHFAVSTVLTAFMAGLALGAYVLGRQIDRRWNPLVVYGVFEIAIGLYALAVPWMFTLLEPVSRWLWVSFSPDFYTFSLMRFVFVGIVLILPTSLMGGTLPALSRFVTRRRERMGLSVGALYGVNTFGAVAGTAATGFALVPVLGVQKTIWLAAALNILVGMLALSLHALSQRGSGNQEKRRVPDPEAGARAGASGATLEPVPSLRGLPAHVKAALVVFALSGFIAMIYEIAWTRVLALVIGSSVYAFTVMLTTFLVGLAAGASLMSGLADRIGERRGLEGIAALLAGTGVTAFVTLNVLHLLPYWFALAFHSLGAGDEAAEDGRAMVVGVKFLMAALVMLPPTLFLGGMFPLVVRICGGVLRKVGRTVGTAYAANTVGTIFGSALGGFLVVPALGIQGSIMTAIVLNLALAGAILLVRRGGQAAPERWKPVAAGACAVAGAAFWLLQPAWPVLVMNSGMYARVTGLEGDGISRKEFRDYATQNSEVIYYEEGITATVMVAEDSPETDNIYLAVDGKVDASSHVDIETQLLSAHIPLLMAEEPRDLAVIGYASGMTVGAATLYDQVRSVTAVEIEPAVIRASRQFSRYNHDPLSNPKVKVVVGDGRNFLQATPRRFDVIISEPSNPWMTIAANLFTREYYEMGRDRLRPGGIFCGWVQLYGLEPRLVRTIIRTFAEVFPNVRVYMPIPFADLILLGSDRPILHDLDRIGRRMSGEGVAADLARIGVERPVDLLTYYIFGDEEARDFGGDGRLNTDDNALVEFSAPLSFYEDTRLDNGKVLSPHISSPLAGARGLGRTPEERAEAYDRLAEAFLDRRIAGRAFKALGKAQVIDPTRARAERVREVQAWFRNQLRQLQQRQSGAGGS